MDIRNYRLTFVFYVSPLFIPTHWYSLIKRVFLFIAEKYGIFLSDTDFCFCLLPRCYLKTKDIKMNINKTFINTLTFNSSEKTYFDDSLKGFGVRVSKTSASYIVMYRNAYGKQKKLTIAKTTQITPAQARDEAKRLLALVVQGEDLQSDKLEKRKALTVSELADEFYAHKKIGN